MSDTLPLAFAGLAGLLLGAIFFGGVIWTVSLCMRSTQPGLCWLGSVLVRSSAVALGFYLVGRGSWTRLIVSLVGFITARMVVAWLTRPSDDLHRSANRAVRQLGS